MARRVDWIANRANGLPAVIVKHMSTQPYAEAKLAAAERAEAAPATALPTRRFLSPAGHELVSSPLPKRRHMRQNRPYVSVTCLTVVRGVAL
jgi:hypothetical protein